MDTIMNDTIVSPGFSAFKADEKFSFVSGYDAKLPTPTGYRKSVVRYRDTTKGVAVKPAKQCIIPQVALPVTGPNGFDIWDLPEKAESVLLGIIEDTQDTIIKDKIADGKVSVINWDDISIDACLNALTAVRVGKRMTKEDVVAWVKVALKPLLDKRAAEISDNQKHDIATRQAQVAATTNAYADGFGSLSAPVPNLGQEKATMLKNMLLVASLSDDMATALLAKLEAILNPVVTADGNM